jgi:broad specificity phosphatase PhoE
MKCANRVVAREQPDALYTSTLIRARETSAALARIRNLPLQLRDAVREIHWR